MLLSAPDMMGRMYARAQWSTGTYGPELPPQQSCWWQQSTETYFRDTDYPGNDIAGYLLSRAEIFECAALCRASEMGQMSPSGCNHWTYVPPGLQYPQAVCYLKHADLQSIAGVGDPGVISGYRHVE